MNEAQIERVRRLCLALPETTEKVAWGEPTWRVKDRLFAMFSNDHHGDGRVAVWLNAPMGVQEHLVAEDAETYFRPPYVGPKGWIGVIVDRVSDDELRPHLVQSYCMVAPKKLLALVSADEG